MEKHIILFLLFLPSCAGITTLLFYYDILLTISRLCSCTCQPTFSQKATKSLFIFILLFQIIYDLWSLISIVSTITCINGTGYTVWFPARKGGLGCPMHAKCSVKTDVIMSFINQEKTFDRVIHLCPHQHRPGCHRHLNYQ